MIAEGYVFAAGSGLSAVFWAVIGGPMRTATCPMEENNTMQFVFWQNMISIHQSALIKALAREHGVLLAVQTDFEGERESSGWTVPDMGNARILISPDARTVEETLRAHPAAVHVFSGISTYPMVYAAFKQAVRRGLKTMVYAEPYRRQGWRGLLRSVKYRFLRLRYGKKIAALLATGRLGVECYRRAGFPADSVFEWGYFTESAASAAGAETPAMAPPAPGEKPDLLFVGQLIPRKNLLPFLRAARAMPRRLPPLPRGGGRPAAGTGRPGNGGLRTDFPARHAGE